MTFMTHLFSLRAALAGASLVLAAGAVPATAAQTLLPGLWQINSKVSSSDAETDATMSLLLNQVGQLPAAQRQQLEALAAQNGVTMPSVSADGALGANVCITPEMAARQQLPTGQPGACTSNNVPVAGGLQLSFTCTQPASSGRGTLRFTGDHAFSMTMNVTTSARGKPEQMNVTGNGKWLGAACPATPAP